MRKVKARNMDVGTSIAYGMERKLEAKQLLLRMTQILIVKRKKLQNSVIEFS